MKLSRVLPIAGLAAVGATVANAETITVATVNNNDMVVMQSLTDAFEQSHPDIKLDWVVLEENVLRQRLTTDIATGGGQFDVMTIGTYEVPIWAERGWLTPLDNLPEDYQADDLLKSVRDGLSHDDTLQALPFYAESSMMYYRQDLFDEAGITMPDQPTWEQVREWAGKLHDADQEQYGICLRGKPGWGENMALVSTMVNSFGGRWFDMDWQPQIDSPAWQEAVSFYVDLLERFRSSRSQLQRLQREPGAVLPWQLCHVGRCHLGGGQALRCRPVQRRRQARLCPGAVAKTPKGSHWLWSWALAIPASSDSKDAARQFITWATSKDYISLVGEREGWTSVPPGTRTSTYENPNYQQSAPFAGFVLDAIQDADPTDSTLEPNPYTGVQFVGIPEFQSIGTQVGQMVAAALTGETSVEQALQASQRATERTMQRAGYLD